MKYTLKIQTNWHDTDAFRRVRPSKILEYMQETANRQCENTGLPLDRLRDEKGLGFILGSVSLKIYADLHAYEDIEVNTWCREAKSYIFNRYFEIMRQGEKIAEASTTWVMLDINTKSMVRADKYEFLKDCFYYDEPIPQESLLPKARIDKDAELTAVGECKICYSHIDYNMHMNNTKYPDLICDFLSEMGEGKRLCELSLSYVKEAALGDTLKIERSKADENGKVLVRGKKENGDTCFDAAAILKDQ